MCWLVVFAVVFAGGVCGVGWWCWAGGVGGVSWWCWAGGVGLVVSADGVLVVRTHAHMHE